MELNEPSRSLEKAQRMFNMIHSERSLLRRGGHSKHRGLKTSPRKK